MRNYIKFLHSKPLFSFAHLHPVSVIPYIHYLAHHLGAFLVQTFHLGGLWFSYAK